MTLALPKARVYGGGRSSGGGVAGRIRIDGRFFVNDAGTFRPLFASALSILVKPLEEQAAVLEEDAALGFNGIRVFAGDLGWAGQTPDGARAALPGLLEAAAARGLYVYVSAITGSISGFDVAAHLRDVAAMCAAAPNALLQIANEPWHPSQSREVNDVAWLLALARRVVPAGVPYDLGAAAQDEVDGDGQYPTDGGAFNDAHLDRGRDKYNQVRRVREIAGISENTRKPAISGEPIGAAEQSVSGKRESDPAFFWILGCLSRGFEVGTVFHSDDGLQARLLEPNQKACATAFVAGFRSLDTAARLTFKNTGWDDSPIAAADFKKIVRAYSFIEGGRGYTVLVGLNGDPAVQFKNGWRQLEVVAEQPGVRVLRIGL